MGQGKRGMVLENSIEQTNKVYRNKGLALVHKEPTPWNVSYDRKTGRVIRAFPQKKGTVDFTGVSHGRSIAFDAKSTNVTTRFPLDNVEPHQVEYLMDHQDQGGISFIIIDFAKKQEHYFMTINQLYDWWDHAESGGRKSIPYEWIMLNCERIRTGNGAIVDYLKFCNTAYKGKVVTK